MNSDKTDCNFSGDLGFMGNDWKEGRANQADSHELNNLATDPKHASIRDELLSRLYVWRYIIKYQGLSVAFRFGGLPPQYPARSLRGWQERLDAWKPWAFREPRDNG